MSVQRLAKFEYKMAKTLILSQYKANQVLYPDVHSMTVNLMTGGADGHAGIRHFTRTLAPGIRLANDHIQFNVKSRVYDKTIFKPSIFVEFKDGKNLTYETFGKDQVQIYNELASLARGRYWLKTQPRLLEKPKLGEPELFAAE